MTNQKKPMFQKRHYEMTAKILGGVESAKLTRPINGDLEPTDITTILGILKICLLKCLRLIILTLMNKI